MTKPYSPKLREPILAVCPCEEALRVPSDATRAYNICSSPRGAHFIYPFEGRPGQCKCLRKDAAAQGGGRGGGDLIRQARQALKFGCLTDWPTAVAAIKLRVLPPTARASGRLSASVLVFLRRLLFLGKALKAPRLESREAGVAKSTSAANSNAMATFSPSIRLPTEPPAAASSIIGLFLSTHRSARRLMDPCSRSRTSAT